MFEQEGMRKGSDRDGGCARRCGVEEEPSLYNTCAKKEKKEKKKRQISDTFFF